MIDKTALISPPDKYFYTVDGKILTDIHQLSEYLKKCSNTNFQYHVSPIRNDFYNWLLHVFGFSELADKIKKDYEQKDVANIIDQFIVESKKISEETKDGKFREFSDEELEKFTKFGIKDKETPADEKLEYLKTELNELRSMIKDLRKTGKDMIIANLILRVVDSKMAFYEYTKSHDDYEKIIQILNDVRKEIDYASQQTETTIADEIIKQLELQRVMLRKDFTPKKMGVLGKIFKSSSQEV